ncbi:stage II sporulation protein P [Paenibacillus turpanensis]|uniref:stage II sporulation protein P n=1 Tax=Paenibacillus turpanensis TaxID=2689078 RepID=UPI00140AB322|nr:stage II sporulation protein P [Paenibacillus turpanensis]
MKLMIFNLSTIRRTLQRLGLWSRALAAAALATLLFFTALGLAGMAQAKMMTSPVSSMKGIAVALSNEFFMDMVSAEVPDFHRENRQSTFSAENVASFVFQLLTSINPHDPKTLVAREVAGMGADQPILFRKTAASDLSSGPMEYFPPAEAVVPGHGGPAPSTPPSTPPTAQPQPAEPTPSSEGKAPAPKEEKPTTGNKKVVFIYHTHNTESWVPEIKGAKSLNDAYHPTKNITLLGKRLAEKLEEQGVGAEVSDTNYPAEVKNFNWYHSYKYSLSTVKEAFATNPDLNFVFDLHRDSSPREKTTVKINGKDYAQVYFIIGHRNPNWKKNEEFAAKINEKLEASYPGISRGIWGKKATDGNAEYNQSVSPNSVLIEIGGPENTLEEAYRTIDVLSKVISDVYWNAEKVNAEAKPKAS